MNFGMLAGVPFILQESLGFSPREFGLIVLLSVGGFTAGTFVNNRLMGRVAPTTIIQFSGWFHVAALIGMAALSLSEVVTWWAIVGPHMVLSFGTGMIVANANAGAVGMLSHAWPARPRRWRASRRWAWAPWAPSRWPS